MNGYDAYDRNTTLYASAMTSSWNEATANWDNLSTSYSTPPVDSAYYVAPGGAAWYDFNVTEVITNSSNDGIMLSAFTKDADFMTGHAKYYSGSYFIFNSSEAGNSQNRPKLTISYTINGNAEEFTLTVNNGSGSGNYLEGTTVPITAKDSLGYEFDQWSGDTQFINSLWNQQTSVTMPGSDLNINALYTKIPDLTLLDQSHIVSGEASSEYSDGYNVNKAVDGQVSTYYHNATDGTGGLPIEITFSLDNSYSLTGFSYVPRNDKSGSRIKDYTLDISSDGINWTEVARGELKNISTTQTIVFQSKTDWANKVRFTALSDFEGLNKASLAEFNLFYDSEVSVKSTNEIQHSNLQTIHLVQNILHLNEFRDESLSIRIVGLNGRVLFNRNIENGIKTCVLPKLPRGVAVIQISGDKSSLTQKVLF